MYVCMYVYICIYVYKLLKRREIFVLFTNFVCFFYLCIYIYIYIYKWGHWLEMDQYKRVPNQCLLIILKRINSVLLIEFAKKYKDKPHMHKVTFSV